MRCPFCRADNDRVIDSRASNDSFSIRRRRECLACFRRFTTYETIEEFGLKVVKKDGSRVPMDREKIRRGLEKACWKRPISPQQIEEVVQAVEREIYNDYESEVESNAVGELVMKYLRDLDQVAYVRFASVYREFQDAQDFVEELQPILAQRRRPRR
jgi:transcriptional repressor NrdR